MYHEDCHSIPGSLSKDDGNGNENATKQSVGWAKTIALHALHVRFTCFCAVLSLQSRRFLTKTRRYIDRGRHLEKQRKRLTGKGGGRGEGRGGERRKPPFPSPSPSPILNPSTSPLKLGFDSSQLYGSINVQDGRTTLFMKTSHGSRSKIRLLCRLCRPLQI